jgi:hypothetical protein
MTITPAAELYQNVQVSLLNPAGKYVAPTLDSLTAAENAMTISKSNSSMVEFDFGSKKAKAATSAYPLASPIYLGVNTNMADKKKLMSMANMVRFVTTKGQTPGESLGQLPGGYAPIRGLLAKQAQVAVSEIKAAVSRTDEGTVVVDPQPKPKPIVVQNIAAGETPKDPSNPISGAALPVALVVFICASMFYVLLRRRIQA